jgi:uncharacterized membrane protein (UPF0127 family)
MRRRVRFLGLAFALALALALAGCSAGVGPDPMATDTPTADAAATGGGGSAGAVSTPGSGYETRTVELVDGNGTRLATVDVWVADSFVKRYTGLSDTGALEPGQGMLFVHDQEGTHTYVMRDMEFPLDIVFAAENGTVTTIHHTPVESDGDLTEYSGRGKYVLEVPMGYTNRTGVEVGDRVRVRDG